MKTILIDNSLSNMHFSARTDVDNVAAYIDALKRAGVSYFEINANAAHYVPRYSENNAYICRVESREDIELANELRCRYAVLRLGNAHFSEELSMPVILELEVDNETEMLARATVFERLLGFPNIGMFRFTGSFNTTPGVFDALVKLFRRQITAPLDIMPQNRKATALDTAITAFAAGVDSVTLSYNGGRNFAPLEEFLLDLATLYHLVFSKEFLAGICVAAWHYSYITGKELLDMKKTILRYRDILAGDDSAELKRPMPNRAGSLPSVQEKSLNRFDLEKDEHKEMLRILDESAADFFRYRSRETNELN